MNLWLNEIFLLADNLDVIGTLVDLVMVLYVVLLLENEEKDLLAGSIVVKFTLFFW